MFSKGVEGEVRAKARASYKLSNGGVTNNAMTELQTKQMRSYKLSNSLFWEEDNLPCSGPSDFTYETFLFHVRNIFVSRMKHFGLIRKTLGVVA